MKEYLFSTRVFIFCLLLVLGMGYCISADQQTTIHTFQRTSNLPEVDRGIAVIETKKGDIMSIGVVKKNPQANGDILLVHSDRNGNIKWTKTYGGEKTDRCYAVDSTKDGYVLLGSTNSYGAGDQDVYLVKIDTQGREQWSKTFGSEEFDMGHDIKQSIDGSYVIIGYTQTKSKGKNDAWILKTDSKGNNIWETIIGEKEDDRIVRGIQTHDGNYIMTGYTKSYGASIWDLLLIKIDNQGKVIWRRNHSGISADLGYGIFESKDGGILLAGQTYSYGDHRGDLWLLKTDGHGKISKE